MISRLSLRKVDLLISYLQEYPRAFVLIYLVRLLSALSSKTRFILAPIAMTCRYCLKSLFPLSQASSYTYALVSCAPRVLLLKSE